MQNLPTEVKDKIIDFKNGDEKYWKNKFKDVENEIKNNVYVYGSCPKCKQNCDDDYPCWLDDLSQLQCDPEWVMMYGNQFEKSSNFKNFWYTCWKTGKYVCERPLEPDLSWLEELPEFQYGSDYYDDYGSNSDNYDYDSNSDYYDD